MKHLFLSAGLLLCSTMSFAQSNQQFCGTKYESSWETPEFNTVRLPGNFAAKSTAAYSIPVVFHIVHDSGPENIPISTVNNILTMVNKRLTNQSPYQNVNGVNTDISLCLATQDPDGNSTPGIIYHLDEATDYDLYRADNGLPSTYPVDSLIKSQYHWPTDKYLNIYIVRSMGNIMTSSATFPDKHGNFMDGIMSNYNVVIQDGAAGTIHEAGHYFGLYHTFQASCDNNDCLNDNDKVCDTPPDIVAEYNPQNCDTNTCTSDENDVSNNNPFRSTTLGGLGDQDDDTRNYMDISACIIKKFTPGQKARMLATLTTVRASLLTSPGCQPASVSSVAKNVISIYPNPTTDRININGADNSIVTLFNALGQQVSKEEIHADKYVMNTALLTNGIYMLVVLSKDGNEKLMRIAKQ